MHGAHRRDGTPQTFCADLSELSFEMIEQENGCATVIRFRLPAENPRMGDTLVVLDGQEIRFHGMISSVDNKGWAIASDRRGSSIPPRNQ
jgi:hypothetical protein